MPYYPKITPTIEAPPKVKLKHRWYDIVFFVVVCVIGLACFIGLMTSLREFLILKNPRECASWHSEDQAYAYGDSNVVKVYKVDVCDKWKE